MELTVKIPQRNKIEKIKLPQEETIGSIITRLGYAHDTIVVLHGEMPIPETAIIKENMVLTVLEITSRG